MTDRTTLERKPKPPMTHVNLKTRDYWDKTKTTAQNVINGLNALPEAQIDSQTKVNIIKALEKLEFAYFNQFNLSTNKTKELLDGEIFLLTLALLQEQPKILTQLGLDNAHDAAFELQVRKDIKNKLVKCAPAHQARLVIRCLGVDYDGVLEALDKTTDAPILNAISELEVEKEKFWPFQQGHSGFLRSSSSDSSSSPLLGASSRFLSYINSWGPAEKDQKNEIQRKEDGIPRPTGI